MNIKRLLTAVSITAMAAGTASATSIPPTAAPLTDVPVATDAVLLATGFTPIPAGGIVLAQELMPGATVAAGNLGFAVQSDTGFIPAANNLVVNINAPAGLAFPGNLSGSVLVGVFSDATIGTPTDNTDDAFVPVTAAATITSQSATGVNLLVSLPVGIDNVSALVFDIPVSLADCAALGGSLTAEITTEAGTPIEQNNLASVANPVSCQMAFNASITADNGDTTIALPNFTELRSNAAGGPVVRSAIGLYNAAIDPAVGIDFAGNPLMPGYVDDVELEICLEDATGVESIEIILPTGTVQGVPSADGLTYSFTLPFTADVANAPVVLEVDGTSTLQSQTITSKNGVANLNDNGPDLVATKATPADASLDALNREGQTFGVFDWNSGPAGAQTISVYRITGLPPSQDTAFNATLINSNTAPFGQTTTVLGTVTADAYGEGVLTSTSLNGAIPADTIRYDLGITFETGNPIDVDRVLSRGGVVTSFGGGANFDFAGDGNTPVNDVDNGDGTPGSNTE